MNNKKTKPKLKPVIDRISNDKLVETQMERVLLEMKMGKLRTETAKKLGIPLDN